MKTIRTFLFVLLVAVIATGLAACAPAAAPAAETAAEPALQANSSAGHRRHPGDCHEHETMW